MDSSGSKIGIQTMNNDESCGFKLKTDENWDSDLTDLASFIERLGLQSISNLLQSIKLGVLLWEWFADLHAQNLLQYAWENDGKTLESGVLNIRWISDKSKYTPSTMATYSFHGALTYRVWRTNIVHGDFSYEDIICRNMATGNPQVFNRKVN